MKILLINACARPESRTLMMAKHFIQTYQNKNAEAVVEELKLYEEKELKYFDYERLQMRNQLIEKKDWNHPMFQYANQIALADRVIVAAPYWDLCFPAIFKIYLENAFVAGITFAYGKTGPVGRCKAEKLVYITTAGGPLNGVDLGGQYMQAVCREFGIKEYEYLCAEGLDVQEWDTKKILKDAMKETESLAQNW